MMTEVRQTRATCGNPASSLKLSNPQSTLTNHFHFLPLDYPQAHSVSISSPSHLLQNSWRSGCRRRTRWSVPDARGPWSGSAPSQTGPMSAPGTRSRGNPMKPNSMAGFCRSQYARPCERSAQKPLLAALGREGPAGWKEEWHLGPNYISSVLICHGPTSAVVGRPCLRT